MRLFQDLSIGKKIALLIFFFLTLLTLNSMFGISKMNAIGKELKYVQSEDMPLIELVSGITVHQLEKAVLIEKAMRVAGVSVSEESLSELADAIGVLANDISQNVKVAEETLAVAKTHAISDKIRTELGVLEANLREIKKEHLNFENNVDRLMALLLNGETDYVSEVAELEHANNLLNKHLEALLSSVEHMTNDALIVVQNEEALALKVMIGIGAGAALLGLLLGIFITRAITQPLERAVQVTERLADGDLTVKIGAASLDETGRLLTAMSKMNARMLDMISQIAAATEQLTNATQEVSVITTQTARNIESQVGHLNQTAVAMNEISATVRDVAQNAAEAAAAADQAEKGVKDGRSIVGEVNLAIKDLASEIEQTKIAITRLDEETESVDSILEVITSVAAQTNLLALNAAIEAARAGEHGRGFAVVADEVRTLASRTQESTTTIQEMISRLKTEARTSVGAMNSGYAKAGVTVELSLQAENTLLEISNAVTTITDMNVQIASAAEEQSVVAEQVNKSVQHIMSAGDETNAGAQQVAVATDELAQLSESLKGIVSQFKLA